MLYKGKRILVPLITRETQGFRESDFCWAEVGELALLNFPCERDRIAVNIDGFCGCRRSFSGRKSHKASTTAILLEVEDTHFLRGLNQEQINWVVRAGRRFKIGDVIERRDTKIGKRVSLSDV